MNVDIKRAARGTACPVRRLSLVAVIVASFAAVTGSHAQTTRSYPYDDPYEARRDAAGASDDREDSAASDAADAQTSTRSAEREYSPDRIDSEERAPRADDRTRTDDRDRGEADGDRAPVDRQVRRLPPPSEYETYVSEIVDKPLRRFGANLLVPAARDFTAPPTTTVPPDYRINPGDEITIGLAGSVEAANLRLIVDNDGRIFVPRVGALNVGGVRYGDLQALMAQRISRVYRSFQINVTAGRLRGVTVYVTGFAATPGSYTLNSLSTLVNAVLAAGGPSAGGSFRSIQLRRGGKLVADFDLYDLLLKGDKRADAVLQNGDVLFIAPVGAQVAVIGSVNNEAIYESRPGDTLNDILVYAGGVNTVADDRRLLVLDPVRADTAGWEELTPAQVAARPARRGEIVRVLSAVGIARPLIQQPVLVTVSGEVARPGRYYVPAGTRLDQVVAQAGGLTAQAYPFASVVTRESVRAQQRLSYERALREMQLLLSTQPLVQGGRSQVGLQPTQIALIQSVTSQLRAREPDGRLVLDITADAATLPAAMTLENNDTVYVPPRPITVGVFGAVPGPATFQYDPKLTIGDFIRKAGGVQKFGDRGEAYVVRANGSLLAPKRGVLSGSIRSQRALPGDLIFVPLDADRGLFWDRFRDITSLLFSGALSAATVAAISN